MAAPLLVGSIFTNAARAVPEHPAIARDGVVLDYGTLNRRSNQAAHALRALGVGHGDRVVVWSDTELDTIPVFIGLAKLGAVFAPIPSVLGADEAADVLATARPTLLAVDAPRAAAGARLAAAAGIAVVGLRGLVDQGPAGAAGDADAAVPSLAALADAQPDAEVDEPALAETDTHVLFFTSGSTGRPKAVVLSHRVNVLRTHPGTPAPPRGPAVTPFPLFHMAAWTMCLSQWQARELVVFTRSDAAAICAAVEQHRAGRLHCIPGLWRRILEHLETPEGKALDLSSVRMAEAATQATPLELLTAIEAALPTAFVRVFYGSTEASMVASLEPADIRRKPGSVGVPAPFAEVRVADDGELWVRGPMLFDGYFENEEATAAALVDGWYRTGDLVDVDDEGYLSIVGRARDLIRSGGEWVAPPEVELVLAAHPALADVAVLGLPDDHWGEVVCAVVVVEPGAEAPTLEQLRAHCEDRLAGFKRPRRLVVIDEIPRTPATGQVQRRLLVDRLS
jgi:acyl-CoA synthetase (AMP-forming)/AMP-acid ligase II